MLAQVLNALLLLQHLSATVPTASVLLLLQQTPPVTLPVNSMAGFTHDGKDDKGAAEVLAECELALSATTVTDLNVSGAIVKSIKSPAKVGANTVNLSGLFAGQPNGAVKLWARVADPAGNWSKWGAPASLVIDGSAPSAPTGLTVSITVTATVKVPAGTGTP